jgi:hypothetical membrane protein
MTQQKYARLVLLLCIAAAVLYNSWPLGYIVNSQTAHAGLASDLERVGQPYYWLFILGDILTGLCLIIACYILLVKLHSKIYSNSWLVVCVGVFLFGIGTAIASVAPAHCSVGLTLKCGTTGNSLLDLDTFFSGIGAFGLFASMLSTCALCLRYRLSTALIRTIWATVMAWSASGILFVVFALSNGMAAKALLLQQIFLILCGAAFIVIGLNIDNIFQSRASR